MYNKIEQHPFRIINEGMILATDFLLSSIYKQQTNQKKKQTKQNEV